MTEQNRSGGWTFQHPGLTRHPGLVLIVTCCLVVLSLIYSATSLRIDTDTTGMISKEVAFRQNQLAYSRVFPAFDETIVAVIDSDTPERSADAAARLAAALRADDEHFSNVDLPGEEPFFKRNGLLYLDLDTLSKLSDRLAEAQPLLAVLAADPNLRGFTDFIRLALENVDDPAAPGADLDRLFNDMAAVVEAALADQPRDFSWQRLLNLGGPLSSGRRLVLIEPKLDFGSLTPGANAISHLRETAEQLGIDDDHGLNLRLTGSVVLEHEELQTVSSGAVWAGLWATAGVTILLIWGLGSVRLIVATLVTLLAGLIITAGIAALLIGRLNLISVTFAVLFVGLGVDFGIHLSLRYKEAIQRQLSHSLALREALSSIGSPLTLSAICAGLGFIAFVPTDYQGLAELGIISAAGMVVAWAMNLTLLPALMNLMPLSSRPSTSLPNPKASSWTERYANVILGLALVLAVSTMPFLLRVSFDFNPLNLKDPKSESVSTFLDLERNPETTSNVINVLAGNLEEADEIAERLRALPEIGDVLTLKSFIPEDQASKLDVIDQTAFFLGSLQPQDKAALSTAERTDAFLALRSTLEVFGKTGDGGLGRLAASLAAFAEKIQLGNNQLLDLEQRLTRHLPALLQRLDQAFQADLIDQNALPPNLRRQWISEASGEARILARPAVGINNNKSLARFADAALKAAPKATGTPIVITQAGRAVVGSFVEASWMAFALITVLLFLILRRVSDVLLVLTPLALAILFTGASSVLLDLQLNFANVIVLPLLLGLGVSGAIHVVMRRQQKQASQGASSTSRAVLFSALTTVASFGSLAVSPHQGMASMGLLLTVAILWSLVCTLIILPALLSLFGVGHSVTSSA
ncbi:MAG: MMPL family transporter [Geminicoccaceae bacterium]